MENPIVGLIMGSIFGACLVLSGLTDPDKIIGSLRLKDFHVIRTVVVFLFVGILGTWILELVGVANLNIKHTSILTVLIGGAFIGTGLGLTGYSPGTGLACAASGRIDALMTMIGMFFGAHVFILIYPSIIMPLEKIANFGRVTLPQITDVSKSSWMIPIFACGSLILYLTRPKKPRDSEQRNNIGGQHMNEDFFDPMSPVPIPRKTDVYIQKDFTGAAQVIRRWKNLFFIIIFLCLVVLQTSFWLVNNGNIALTQNIASNDVLHEGQPVRMIAPEESASSQLPRPTVEGPERPPGTLNLLDVEITFEHLRSVINIANAILIFSSALYGFTIFYGLAASFGGRLGGLKHISHAGVYSLVMFVLLLPWQFVFGSIILGARYTPREPNMWHTTGMTDTLGTALLYFRFSGYSILIFILLILAQFRSLLWSKSLLHKFEQEAL